MHADMRLRFQPLVRSCDFFLFLMFLEFWDLHDWLWLDGIHLLRNSFLHAPAPSSQAARLMVSSAAAAADLLAPYYRWQTIRMFLRFCTEQPSH